MSAGLCPYCGAELECVEVRHQWCGTVRTETHARFLCKRCQFDFDTETGEQNNPEMARIERLAYGGERGVMS